MFLEPGINERYVTDRPSSESLILLRRTFVFEGIADKNGLHYFGVIVCLIIN